VRSNFIVLAMGRDEEDSSKEGLGYTVLRTEEVDNHRLIGKVPSY
jgi:hypothetical protein